MNTNETTAIGIDLGGTKIEAALVSESGEIRERLRQPTNVQAGPSGVQQQILAMIEELQGKQGNELVSGIGVGVAGQIEAQTGRIRRAPNLEWKDVPLQADLQPNLESPVVVMNDVRAATWGEWLFGAGQGTDDLLCLFIGTGVGGGVVSGGHMLEGHSNTAGELGHVIVNFHGPVCSCGNRGCLESLVGGWAIAHQAQENIAADPTAGQMLLLFAQGQKGNVTARTVARAYHEGDPLAQRIVDDAAQALAAGALGLVHAFNPQRFILGGGVIEGLPGLIEHVRKEVKAHAMNPAVESLEVLEARLEEDAGVIGAAAVAQRISAGKRVLPAAPA